MTTANQLAGLINPATGRQFSSTEPAGSVLQVVSTAKTDTFAAGNTGSYINITGLNLSITPTSTASRIIITVSLGVVHTWNAGRDRTSAFRIFRNGSDTVIAGSSSNRARALFRTGSNNTDGNHGYGASFTFIDTPNTTSAITYQVAVEVEDGATFYLNSTVNDSDLGDSYGARTVSTITAMEIAG